MARLTAFSRLLIVSSILGGGYLAVKYAMCGSKKVEPKYEVSKTISNYDNTKDEIKDAISQSLSNRAINTILIADYLNLDNEQDKFGSYLAEDFSALFSRSSNSFRVIERSRLNLLLQEQKLKAAGLLDQKTVSELGKIIGVEAVITGKYQVVGEFLKLWIKVIDIEKSELILTKEAKIPIEGELKDASKINPWWK